MADTYTTNLNLKKPGYDSPADIKDLNDNFDKIDNSVSQLSEQISDEWTAGKSYSVGDYCIYNNTLYKCKIAHTSGSAFVAEGYWDVVMIGNELSFLQFRNFSLPVVQTYFSTAVMSYQTFGKMVIVNAELKRNDVVMPATFRENAWASGLPRPDRNKFFYANVIGSNNVYRFCVDDSGNLGNAYSEIPQNISIILDFMYISQ